MDELGLLIAGHAKNAYWFGSQLTIEEARRVAPHNSATSLQVPPSTQRTVCKPAPTSPAALSTHTS
jgi:homospermidine synthase